MDRLERTARLLGLEAMGRLRGATVAVFGLGGVGSFCAEALARSGVGCIRIVDHDVVSETNCNRQIGALGSTIGQPKVDVLGARLRDIDERLRVECYRRFFALDTVDELLGGELGFVVDAIDSLGPKVELLYQCQARGIQTVTVLGAAAKMDVTQIRVGPLEQTVGDPLASRVRKLLRRRGPIGAITAVYSAEPRRPAAQGPWALMTDDLSRGRQRMIQPSMVMVPGAMGLAAAGHVVQAIGGRAPRL